MPKRSLMLEFLIKRALTNIDQHNTITITTLEIMTTEHAKIQCAGHGETYSTYVCEHLASTEPQEWFGSFPEEDNPWPDAWCAKCNSIFLREGEWNEKNEKEMKLKIICDRCYSDARSASVDYLSGSHREKWNSFVSDCCSELDSK